MEVAPNTDPENGQPLRQDSVCDAAPKVDLYLEKLLSRIRSDSVYELRKLQHQHKPVTEFGSKQALEELLEKRCHALPARPESAAGPYSEVDVRVKQFSSISNGDASASSPQEHMSPSVRLEIRGLIERQRVRGFLNSVHASDIERTLQEGLVRRNRRQQRREAPGQARQGGRERLPEVRGDLQVQDHAESGISVSTPREPENGQYQMPRRDQSSIIRQLQESPALNTLQPVERDRVLSEVDHLVQQHLVTSALSGEFRGILELHIQNRADQVRNGVTVEDIGRSLQRRSVHSASTAARSFDPEIPSSASMSELRQELSDMKSEILELKQLMRTSFDLQMEIQRAIRQEVAAALSSACTPTSQPIAPTAMLGGQSNVAVNSGHCVICSEANINSVVYRCGHMCVCMQCGLELKAQGLKCPICRAPITDIVRAYSSMQ